jgi:hypothetical protein
MGDRDPDALALLGLWTALSHRWAAAVGASTALISLLAHASVKTASIRGGLAWFVLLAAARVCRWLLACTAAASGEGASGGEPGEETGT